MSKLQNAVEDIKGKVKEEVGNSTKDRGMQAEGVAEQVKASVKQAGEHVRDAIDNVKKSI